ELTGDRAAEPHDVLRVLDRLVELRGVLIDHYEVEAGRRQLSRHVEDRVGLLGNEDDLGGHVRLLYGLTRLRPVERSPSPRSGATAPPWPAPCPACPGGAEHHRARTRAASHRPG